MNGIVIEPRAGKKNEDGKSWMGKKNPCF